MLKARAKTRPCNSVRCLSVSLKQRHKARRVRKTGADHHGRTFRSEANHAKEEQRNQTSGRRGCMQREDEVRKVPSKPPMPQNWASQFPLLWVEKSGTGIALRTANSARCFRLPSMGAADLGFWPNPWLSGPNTKPQPAKKDRKLHEGLDPGRRKHVEREERENVINYRKPLPLVPGLSLTAPKTQNPLPRIDRRCARSGRERSFRLRLGPWWWWHVRKHF